MRTHLPDRRHWVPDWLLGAAMRLALAPGLWLWGRAHATDWPDAIPEMNGVAAVWDVPFIQPEWLARIVVWGSQIIAAMLVVGLLTRLVGLALLAATLVYMIWIAPHAWTSALMFGGIAGYLAVRGGGAISVDGALVATTR
ncbi:DoxX family protein [Maricaulis sp. CAU 1757]